VWILIKGDAESSSTSQKGIFGIVKSWGVGAKDGVQKADT